MWGKVQVRIIIFLNSNKTRDSYSEGFRYSQTSVLSKYSANGRKGTDKVNEKGFEYCGRCAPL